MEIWYRATRDGISTIEIEKETNLFVVKKNGNKTLKNGDWDWYRKTKEEAKNILMAAIQGRIDSLKKQLEREENFLKLVDDIK